MITDEDYSTLVTSDFSPNSNIIEQESDKLILLMGSFVCILNNRKTNITNFVIYLIDHPELHDYFINIIGVDTFQDLLQLIFKRFPQLCTSKTISRYANQL